MTAFETRYELGDALGAGGMADVLEAYDRKLERRVAVKLLRRGLGDPSDLERFAREARIAAGFSHPNVVTVYDVGSQDGRPYLVMELVDGRTLAELLATRGALTLDDAFAITDSVLAALEAAHAQGLVHRDVKPANVLLARDGRVKLTDFGIATAAHELGVGLTATGQLLGTPGYLPPETVSGATATPRSDVYATGVVLYEMLAGGPPFTAEHPLALALAHRDTPVPPIEQRRPGLSPELAAVVARSLEKDPAARYADGGEMRAALRTARAAAPASDAGPTLTALATPSAAIGGAAAAAAATTSALASTAVAPVPEPSPTRTQPRARARRRWRGAAALAAGALLGGGVVVALGALDSSGRDPLVAVPPTLAPTTTPTAPLVNVPLVAVAPTTATTLPTTIGGLLDLLISGTPAAYGEKGRELFDQLLALRNDPHPKAKQADRLAREIDRWVRDGQLDPTIGALATQILSSSPSPQHHKGD